MSWDWNVTVTGVVAVAGIWGTLHANKRQIDAQKDMAREDRQERRLEASYTELLVKVGQADDWAYQHQMRWSKVDPDVPWPPDRPDLFVKTLGARGVLSIHWSPRVRQLVDEMTEQIDICFKAYLRNGMVLRKQLDPDPDFPRLVTSYWAAKERITEIDQKIREQCADELAGKHDGHAE